MRYALILLILSVSMTAQAAQKLVIKDNLSLTGTVRPDKMVSTTNVVFKSANYQQVSAEMEKLASVVKSHKEICVYSSYSISPRYYYDKGEIVNRYYQGSITTSCTFTDVQLYDGFVNAILKLTSKGDDHSQTFSPVRWTVSEETSSKKFDELKKNTVKQALSAASDYSKYTGMNCSLENISFLPALSQPVLSGVSGRAFSESSVSAPDKEDIPLEVKAEITIGCE